MPPGLEALLAIHGVWLLVNSLRHSRHYCFFDDAFDVEKLLCHYAVMLHREHRRLLQKAERRVVYVAEAEVECPGRIETNGEVHKKPTGGTGCWWSPTYARSR